ncbi:hypothetical protein F4678DRAFT_273011 [Xylaria arbuscula]|nr:hypothetical protein F4678DRAFT_273011 [Xylaria arbuscula]
MASKAFFDPLVVLRIAPVVTSTMAMRFSHDQYFFLSNLLAPEHRDKANSIVPSYFTTFFMRGIWDIGILYTLTPAFGITNFYSRPNGAWKWYAAGTAFAFFHMAFVPLVMHKVKGLFDDEPKGQGNKNLREWLNVHILRSWVADIPAWTCFVIGCLKSLQPL